MERAALNPMEDDLSQELGKQVERARRGDAQASSEIIRLSQARIYRFCLFLCHDRALAQDLAQDTYVRALEELGKLKDPAKCLSWLYKIAKNLFLDHLKSPKNAPSEELSDAHAPQDASLAAGDAEFTLHLKQTLDLLAPQDRLLLLLVDLEQRTYSEAAEIIGISESNVRFRLHHIRKEFVNKYES
jgi:RNA polymerase sigma-70 factor (ECF subfamily)